MTLQTQEHELSDARRDFLAHVTTSQEVADAYSRALLHPDLI